MPGLRVRARGLYARENLLASIESSATVASMSKSMTVVGRAGGIARAKALSKRRRSQIARAAAKARWGKRRVA